MQLFLQRLTMLAFIITVILAMLTMGLSWKASNLKSQQIMLEKEIKEVRIAIRVLEAEWSRLNQPSLLSALADQYLDMKKVAGDEQITDIRVLPTKKEVAALVKQQHLDPQAEITEKEIVDEKEKRENMPTSSAQNDGAIVAPDRSEAGIEELIEQASDLENTNLEREISQNKIDEERQEISKEGSLGGVTSSNREVISPSEDILAGQRESKDAVDTFSNNQIDKNVISDDPIDNILNGEKHDE